MQDRSIGELMRPVRVLLLEDPLSKAAGLLRASGLPELPVINYGRVVGMVYESDMVSALADDELGGEAPVSKVMRSEPVLANKYMSLGQVADILSQGKMAVLPVVDEFGAYQGLIARSDVVAILGKVLRPPNVAGMATPLGVHLTTGAVSAGPGSLGLFLTGASLCLLIFLASSVCYGLAWVVQRASGLPIIAMLESPAIPVMNLMDLPMKIFGVMQGVLVLLLLRLSPLSGYHAAEHMTVHAMEQGEQIEPEVVKQMPRVHPRCGTNILAAAGVFLIITTRFSNALAVLMAIVIVILGWRTIGAYFQYFFTTKTPNDKQLANGVKVGTELLEKYQANPNLQVDNLHRIWNAGLLQTATGLVATYVVLSALANLLGLSSVLMPF